MSADRKRLYYEYDRGMMAWLKSREATGALSKISARYYRINDPAKVLYILIPTTSFSLV